MAHTMFEYRASSYKGSVVEEEFKKAFSSMYPEYSVRYTTSDENKKKHIDIVCEKQDKQWTFDVKAQKLISRGDKTASEDFTWVELQNNFGGPGWAKGEEMHIAFEINDHFIIVERQRLLDLVESRKLPGLNVENNNLPAYSQYQRARWGNKDICVLTPIKDIYDIKLGIIPKCNVKA